MSDRLTVKEQRFADEYVVDFNGARAAERAGYGVKNLKIAAYKMLKKQKIRAAIDEHLKELAEDARLRSEAILLELAKIAYVDIGDILDFSGAAPRLKPASEIPAMARQAIESIKVKRYTEGRGENAENVEVTEFKLLSKLDALDKLGKYRRLFVDRVESRDVTLEDYILQRAQRPRDDSTPA